MGDKAERKVHWLASQDRDGYTGPQLKVRPAETGLATSRNQ